METNHDGKKGSSFASRANIVLIGFLVIGGFYLATEHRAHLYGWLPWLLLLACPLMHLFMHGSHGNNRNVSDGRSGNRESTPSHRH